MAQHPSDCLRVLNLIKEAKKPTVGHCMGEIGLPSRILSLRYGAPFIYAAFNKERGIAPGLPSFEEVKRYFHVARHQRRDEGLRRARRPGGPQLQPGSAQPDVPPDRDQRRLPAVPRAAR